MIRIIKFEGLVNVVIKSFVTQFKNLKNATTSKKWHLFEKNQNSIILSTTIIGFQFSFASKCDARTDDTTSPSKNDNLNNLLKGATDAIKNEDFQVAKFYLYKALQKAEKDKNYDLISIIFDNLAAIAIKKGTFLEVEDLLVQFIEKLISIGYPENGNSIIRFKLKLSRIYYLMGNTGMAELGFRDCVNTQEQKILKKDEDTATNQLYISALFWYGRFLTEEEDFDRARIYVNKCLKHAKQIEDNLTTPQIMVILFHNAEVAFKLKVWFFFKLICFCQSFPRDINTESLIHRRQYYIHRLDRKTIYRPVVCLLMEIWTSLLLLSCRIAISASFPLPGGL